jgi:hypothetical protein
MDQRMAGDLLGQELLRAYDLQELIPGLRDGVRGGMNLRDLMFLLSMAEQEAQRIDLM